MNFPDFPVLLGRRLWPKPALVASPEGDRLAGVERNHGVFVCATVEAAEASSAAPGDRAEVTLGEVEVHATPCPEAAATSPR